MVDKLKKEIKRLREKINDLEGDNFELDSENDDLRDEVIEAEGKINENLIDLGLKNISLFDEMKCKLLKEKYDKITIEYLDEL